MEFENLQDLYVFSENYEISLDIYPLLSPGEKKVVDILRLVRSCMLKAKMKYAPVKFYSMERLLRQQRLQNSIVEQCMLIVECVAPDKNPIIFENLEVFEVRGACFELMQRIKQDYQPDMVEAQA